MEEYHQKHTTPPASAPEFGISSTAAPYNYNGDEPDKAMTAHQAHHQWSTGLCDCFSHPKNCCITCWCPCITFGQVAEIVDRGSSSCGMNGALYTLIAFVTGCSCIYSYFYRAKMRDQYSLRGSTCNDCLLHFFCESCALCQEYRELERHGFDMALGWHGNMEKQNRSVIRAPVVEQGMYK